MLFSHATLLLAFASSLVSARPYYKRWDGDSTPESWQGGAPSRSSGWRNSANNRWQQQKSNSLNLLANTCSLASAKLPEANPPLPPPAAGLSLFQVVVGRGTQNYTCDLSNSTAVPVAAGALASLYNVSCLAARTPELLSALPAIALQLPAPAQGLSFSADLSGHHYFLDATTPFFNLDTAEHQYGTGAFSKNASSPAPASAMKGQNGQGYGAVAWLQLVAKKGSAASQKLQQVYRVNTQGGNPPASCTGQQAAFEVPYSAEYWIYA